MLGAFLATVLGFGSLVASENLSFGDFAPELEAYFVTANRTPVAIGLVPQSVGWVDSLDLELTPAAFGTDLLKKNFPLDVIQYPGGSSGISIRGFRPQYSHETNPTTLMLIDGRPVSISAGAIPMHGIERIEILRGPASALYGPSAMGGVVNILTKRSEGPFVSRLSTGYGSYERVEAGVSAGGLVHPRFSFDVSLDWVERVRITSWVMRLRMRQDGRKRGLPIYDLLNFKRKGEGLIQTIAGLGDRAAQRLRDTGPDGNARIVVCTESGTGKPECAGSGSGGCGP